MDIIISERDKLKTLVREQTEADLLVNALRGLGIIPKPIEYDAFSEQRRPLAQQQATINMNTGLYGYGGLSGFGSFLGGVFNR